MKIKKSSLTEGKEEISEGGKKKGFRLIWPLGDSNGKRDPVRKRKRTMGREPPAGKVPGKRGGGSVEGSLCAACKLGRGSAHARGKLERGEKDAKKKKNILGRVTTKGGGVMGRAGSGSEEWWREG